MLFYCVATSQVMFVYLHCCLLGTVDVQICRIQDEKRIASAMNHEFYLCSVCVYVSAIRCIFGFGTVSSFSCCLNINNSATVARSQASIFWQIFLVPRQKQCDTGAISVIH